MRLWRPTGMNELRLIYESGMRSFPARLVDQPIFYPVTNKEYASQIALEWNAHRSGAGYVLSFEIPDANAEQFERKVVGGTVHEELWIPAELLADLNAHIDGTIELSAAFFSADFEGYQTPMPSFGGLHEAFHSGNPKSQLSALCSAEMQTNLDEAVKIYNTSIFITYPYWCAIESMDAGNAKDALLAAMNRIWQNKFSIPLCANGAIALSAQF